MLSDNENPIRARNPTKARQSLTNNRPSLVYQVFLYMYGLHQFVGPEMM